MKLYEILPNGYLGAVVEVDDATQGIRPGLTDTAPEFDISEGQWAYWIGSGWVLTSTDPAQSIITPEPLPDPIPDPIPDPQVQLPLPLEEFVDPAQGI